MNEVLIYAAMLLVLWLVSLLQATMSITTSWTIAEPGEGGGIAGNVVASVTGNSIISMTVSVPAGAVNQLLSVSWVIANIQALIMTANLPVVIKTNNTTTPPDTIDVGPTAPWSWINGSGIPIPLVGTTGDITAMYLSNAGTAAATLKFRGLQAL